MCEQLQKSQVQSLNIQSGLNNQAASNLIIEMCAIRSNWHFRTIFEDQLLCTSIISDTTILSNYNTDFDTQNILNCMELIALCELQLFIRLGPSIQDNSRSRRLQLRRVKQKASPLQTILITTLGCLDGS
ncbi:hypothetical protein FGO68_gene5681 [Halteria grandinella]|uniref:Uncharacterized protein n=1 Tax=Halteria grandinella TaxID=5974 RepID=A0A8J8P3S2_HALGN|nr:hypothetical protein FGO68_gene5681 [Halteria grandinella]